MMTMFVVSYTSSWVSSRFLRDAKRARISSMPYVRRHFKGIVLKAATTDRINECLSTRQQRLINGWIESSSCYKLSLHTAKRIMLTDTNR